MPMKTRGSKKATQFTESVIREMTRLSAAPSGGVNLSQGFPDFPAPAAIKDAACAAIHADVNQYAVTWGARPLREAIAREFTRRYGVPVVADEQVTVCCGVDRGDDGDDDGDHRPGRRGGRLRAVLRELRPRRDPLRRDAALRHAARAGLDLRSRRAGGGVQRADAARSSSTRRTTRPARCSRAAELEAIAALCRKWDVHRDLRRDLRAHHLRRPRARADRDARRDGRSHGHDQRPVEDLQRDRLAGRLDDLAAVADRRDPQGARLPDRRRAGAAAGGGRGGARRCPTATTPIWPPATGAPRHAARDPRAPRLHVLQAARRVLHHDGHQRRSASTTTSRSRGIW